MKRKFITKLFIAAFLFTETFVPVSASASHSFLHIIEQLQTAILDIHRRLAPSPSPATATFQTGDRVIAQSAHGTRTDPAISDWISTGAVPAGTRGIVIGSARTILGVTWWNVLYDTGVFGWARESAMKKDSAPSQSSSSPAPAAALRYFGYAMIDCGTNYIDDVFSFTNLAHLCVSSPTDNIIARLDRFADRGVKAVISLDAIFFTSTSVPGCVPNPFEDRSCILTTLRADYRTRWNTFIQTNRLKQQEAKIGAWWMKDEPAWNNLSPAALAQAATVVKEDFPDIPTLAIEGWPAMARFQMPPSIDWIGFDFYAVRNPVTNAQYQYYHTILRERRLPGQKILVIMDGAWRASLQGSTGIFPWAGVGGLTQTDMAEVARNYYLLAKSDPNIIGIGVFLWPSGIVTPDQIGSRDLPASVRAEHIRIGKEITRKP